MVVITVTDPNSDDPGMIAKIHIWINEQLYKVKFYRGPSLE